MANKEHKLIPNPQEKTTNIVMTIRNKEMTVCDGDSEELNNSLPYDIIIYDILTRVPIDSLMRFRCVCKAWSTLIINDSQFTNLHYGRQTYRNRGIIWLSETHDDDDYYNDRDHRDEYFSSYTKSYGIVLFDYDKKKQNVFYFTPESGLFNKRLFIQDSVNGLLLLSCHTEVSSCSHHVYNPITGYSYKLPVRNAFVRRMFDRLYFHLVYNSVTGKYKVLCLCKRNPCTSDEYFLKIVTIGTGNDAWRDVDFPKVSPYFGIDFTNVFASGCFNWLTCESEILRFDVNTEEFDTIKYPEGCSNLNDISRIIEIEGSLCFIDYIDNAGLNYEPYYKGKLKLWILKEDDEKKKHEWTLTYDIVEMFRDTDVPGDFYFLYSPVILTIVSHPTPKIIFAVSGIDYDEIDQTQRRIDDFYGYDVNLKKLDFISQPYYKHCKWHVSSLVRF